MIRAAALVAILLAAGGAAPRDPFAGRVAVATTRCVGDFGDQGLVILDDRTLLYRPTGKTLYRNTLEASCPGLEPDDLLVIERFGSQYCEHDRFRAVHRGSTIPGPFCRLGPFTAYERTSR